MRKTILLFGLITFFLFSPTSGFAVSPDRLPSRPPRPAEKILRAKNATSSGKLQQVGAKLTEKKRNLIRAYFERMLKRIEAAVTRLERLISRLESRIKKLETEGKNTVAVETQLGKAKEDLTKTKADLVAARQTIDQMLKNDHPQADFIQVRNLVKTIKTDLVALHRLLVHLIGDVQGLRVGTTKEQPTLQTTPTIQPTPTPIPTI